MAALAKAAAGSKTEDHWLERFRIVLQRVEDMIYKGSQYFLPELCPEFHGGRVVWNLPRFEKIIRSALVWKMRPGEAAEKSMLKYQKPCEESMEKNRRNYHAGRA